MHDIGKNIFKSLAEAAGFDVFDLGINTYHRVLEKVKEVEADIVGMSGAINPGNTSNEKKTVDSLEEAGAEIS